jgi:hypothetical protein
MPGGEWTWICLGRHLRRMRGAVQHAADVASGEAATAVAEENIAVVVMASSAVEAVVVVMVSIGVAVMVSIGGAVMVSIGVAVAEEVDAAEVAATRSPSLSTTSRRSRRWVHEPLDRIFQQIVSYFVCPRSITLLSTATRPSPQRFYHHRDTLRKTTRRHRSSWISISSPTFPLKLTPFGQPAASAENDVHPRKQ